MHYAIIASKDWFMPIIAMMREWENGTSVHELLVPSLSAGFSIQIQTVLSDNPKGQPRF